MTGASAERRILPRQVPTSSWCRSTTTACGEWPGIVGRWPWPRLAHATLLDFLARAPAKLVVYDVLFTEPDLRRFTIGEEEWTGAESDQALADAISEIRQRHSRG